MKKNYLACSYLSLLASSNAISDFARSNVRRSLEEASHKVVRVDYDLLKVGAETQHELNSLLQDHDADRLGLFEGKMQFRLHEDGVHALNEHGFDFEDITESFAGDLERRLQDSDTFEFCDLSIENAEDCATESFDEFYNQYQPYESITARFSNLIESSPVANSIVLGQSYEGRDLTAVEIVSDPSVEKPLAFYFCNIHAREWIVPIFCTYFTETLLNYEQIPGNLHPLLEHFDITIHPIGNPDGLIFSWTNDTMWRKTRKPNEGSECVGTDPNRNYDASHCGMGTSNDPCSNNFCGITPFDNPETAAIGKYIVDNGERMISMGDIHAWGSMWLLPLGDRFTVPVAEDYHHMMGAAEAAVTAVEEINNRSLGDEWLYGPISEIIYLASGSSVDFAYMEAGIVYSYGVEARTTVFQPPSTNIMPSNIELFAGIEANLNYIAAEELGVDFGDDGEEDQTPSPPPTLYPSITCRDAPETRLYYDNGTMILCQDFLEENCTNNVAVYDRCPVFCNSCPDFSVEQEGGTESSDDDDMDVQEILLEIVLPSVIGAILGLILVVKVNKRYKPKPTQEEEAKNAVDIVA